MALRLAQQPVRVFIANDLLAAQAREQESSEYHVPAAELEALRERIEGVLAESAVSA